MAAKQLMFDQAARQKVFNGLEKLAGAVKVTLGPSGRNVVLQKSWGCADRDEGRRERGEGSRT